MGKTSDYYSDASHDERKVYDFILDGETIDVFMTSHGHYRILQHRKIDFEQFGRIITSIGEEKMRNHFKEALEKFPLDARSHVDWKTQIDYVISYYDVVHNMVIMAGFHPHLKRITIVTIIPRIEDVFSKNVFATYRIDDKETIHIDIRYKIPHDLKMNHILWFEKRS